MPLRMPVRYKVLALTVGLAGLTYLDRVCISTTAPFMMRELHLSRVQMGMVFSAFTLAYGLFAIPIGAWGDRVGTRTVLARMVIWWSSFTMLTATASGFASLVGIRFLFGIGEAGAWPNVARTISRWFPRRERGRAQGIFFMGAHIAGGVTPLIVSAVMQFVNWRYIFVIFGGLGYMWAFVWHSWFRNEPSEHREVRSEELQSLEDRVDLPHQLGPTPWLRIASNKSVWGLCGMYFAQTYGFYFLITWLPTYLSEARHFSAFRLGMFAGLPLLCSVAADLLGGITSDALSQRVGIRLGRGLVGVSSFLLASGFILFAAATPSAVLAAICISIAAAWSNFILGAAWGTAVDIGGNYAGTVSAVMNTAGQAGGAMSPLVLALLVDRFHSWSVPLYVTGALYFLGAFCWFAVNPASTVGSDCPRFQRAA